MPLPVKGQPTAFRSPSDFSCSQSAQACILLRTSFPHHCLRSASSEPRQTSRFCFGQEASPFLEAARQPPGRQRPPPMADAPRLGPATPGSRMGHRTAQLWASGVVVFFLFSLKLMLCFSPESATNGNFRIPLFSKNYRLLVSSSVSQAINH